MKVFTVTVSGDHNEGEELITPETLKSYIEGGIHWEQGSCHPDNIEPSLDKLKFTITKGAGYEKRGNACTK
jgi:hypothetical protein